jgi:hypothetical protein
MTAKQPAYPSDPSRACRVRGAERVVWPASLQSPHSGERKSLPAWRTCLTFRGDKSVRCR